MESIMKQARIVDISDNNLQQVIADSNDMPVLICFCSDQDPTNPSLIALLNKLALEYADKLVLATLNCDQHPILAAQFGLSELPSFYLFEHGQPVNGLQGAQSEQTIRELLQSVLPNETEQARSLIAQGEYDKAILLLKNAHLIALQSFGTPNPDIVFLLVDSLLKLKRIEEAGDLLFTVAAQHHDEEYQRLLTLITNLKQQASSPEIDQLHKELDKDPDNTVLIMQLANQLHEVGRSQEALALLFKQLEQDINVDNEKIKQELLSILTKLGTTAAVATIYRRKLYSLLH